MYSKLNPLDVFSFTPLEPIKLQGHRVHAHSKYIEKGDVFVAYQGEYKDGRSYIPMAVAQGASCVIYDQDNYEPSADLGVKMVGMSQLPSSAGLVAGYLLGSPSEHLRVIGVTGTNGKTSITQWLAQLLDLLGDSCAIMGTVGNGFWGKLNPTTHTTPDAVTVQNLLKDFRDDGATHVAMEVSSHGLDQSRVNGVVFETAVLTNLTRDHLDYHQNMAAYAAVKKQLFYWQGLKHALINIDDAFGRLLAEELKQEEPDLRLVSYGFSADADISIMSFQPSLSGSQISIQSPWGDAEITVPLLGRFNMQNLAASLAVLCLEGHDFEAVCRILPLIEPARGRMQSIIEDQKPLVIIDYAHTPDALEKALSTLQELKITQSRLWCVFGCGGNRDKGKRPLMGDVATRLADCVVVTSDNPRLEDPDAIIQDILPSVPRPEYVDVSREAAIVYAVSHASVHDIVLIAGKGHETYQDINGIKEYFDDFDVAKRALNTVE